MSENREAGFTLIELLVALALAAMIGVVLVLSLTTARQGLAFTARTGATSAIQAARSYVRQSLLQAEPLAAAGNGPDSEASFDGTSEAMTYFSSYAPAGAYGGLYRMEIAVAGSVRFSGGFDLVVRQRLARAPVQSAAAGQPPQPAADLLRTTVLAENIKGAEFQYFVRNSAEDGTVPSWNTSWRHPSILPALVAVMVTFKPGDPRDWPRLNVPIVASAASATVCPPRTACR
jgi:general secretion pathway protein J